MLDWFRAGTTVALLGYNLMQHLRWSAHFPGNAHIREVGQATYVSYALLAAAPLVDLARREEQGTRRAEY